MSHPRPSDSSDIPASAIPDWISSCWRTCVRRRLFPAMSCFVYGVEEPARARRVRKRGRLRVDRGRDREDRSVALAQLADKRGRGRRAGIAPPRIRGRLDGTEVVGSGNPETPCRRMHRATLRQYAIVCAEGASSSQAQGSRGASPC